MHLKKLFLRQQIHYFNVDFNTIVMHLNVYLNAIMHFNCDLNAIVYLFKLKWITIAQNEMRKHWNICFIHKFFFLCKEGKKCFAASVAVKLVWNIHTVQQKKKSFSQCNLYCVSYRNGLKGFRYKTVDIYEMVAAAILWRAWPQRGEVYLRECLHSNILILALFSTIMF